MKLTQLILVGMAILALAACGKGRDGLHGELGERGPKGDSGDTVVGPAGPRGADGEIAEVIQLCPGTSTYGVFVEVALCINSKLYAVYSANGGFLTYLAPGNYASNAIGSACNLTVLPNCRVQ